MKHPFLEEQLLELYRQTILTLGVATFFINKKGQILFVNDISCKLLKYSKEELLTLSIYDIDPSMSRMSWKKFWEATTLKNQVIDNIVYASKLGKEVSLNIKTKIFTIGTEQFCAIVTYNGIESIRYKNLLNITSENVEIGGWEWDITKEQLYFTDSMSKILALKKAKNLLTKTEAISLLSNYFEKINLMDVIIPFQKAIEEQKTFEIELELNQPNQEKRWIFIQGIPVLKEGKVQKINGIIRDISLDKVKARSLELTQFTVDKASQMIFWVNETGKLLYVNEAVLNKYGYALEEMKGLNVSIINPSLTPERFKQIWEQTKSQKQIKLETEHLTKDKTKFPVLINANFITYDEKSYICVYGTDMTTQKLALEEKERHLKEIKKLKEKIELEKTYLLEEVSVKSNFNNIITQSPKYKKVLRQVEQVANTNATVLVLGETGTGKELLAAAIHQLSSRSNKPLVKINCATLPKELIESVLFGHEKGAFTGAHQRKIGRFELAHNGTIFLDEIGEMPVDLQAKLLRVLQEGEIERLGNPRTFKVDVRVIAATNRNLEQLVAAGKFREDLFYRLNVFPIYSLPLREHSEDIPLLIRHFCNKYMDKIGRKITKIPQQAVQKLLKYDFPGNIRELENIVERAVILSQNDVLNLDSIFPFKKKLKEDTSNHFKTFEAMQKAHILEALNRTNWRVSGELGAANLLGLKAKTLFSKMRKLNIKRENFLNI